MDGGHSQERTRPVRLDGRSAGNLEATVHPKRLMAIAYSRGTVETGDPSRTPETAREKGRATSTVVDGNQLTFVFAGLEDAPKDEYPTYFLLVWVDDATLEFRVELSLPGGMSSDQHVTYWLERIIIPTDDSFGSGARSSGTPQDGADDDVMIAVERRAG